MGVIQPSIRNEVAGYSKEFLLQQYALVLSGNSGFSRKKRDLITERVMDVKAGVNLTNSEILINGISEFRATQMAGTALMCVITDVIYLDQLRTSQLPHSPVTVRDGELYLDGAMLVSLSKYNKHFQASEQMQDSEFKVKPLKNKT